MEDRRPFRGRRVAARAATRFTVWNGTTIAARYHSVADLAQAVRALVPGAGWDTVELLLKAGEGGTYQGGVDFTWQDRHPLAITGPGKLQQLIDDGRSAGLTITPYVNVRGHTAWNAGEWAQIADCARIAGRVVLNLEPGATYWGGDTDPALVQRNYLAPLVAHVRAAAPTASLELAVIPRQWVIDALGGIQTFFAWLRVVQRCSWEMYGASAHDLDPGLSASRVRGWFTGTQYFNDSAFCIPIIQRSMIAAWAGDPICRPNMEVWTLDSD